MRICRTAADTGALAARLDRLEERVRLLHEREPAAEAPEAGPARTVVESIVEEPAVADADDVEDEDDSEPSPAAEVDQPDSAAGEFSMEDVDAAWPAIMARVRDEAGMRRHALFREARPAAVEGTQLILEVPGHLPFHLAQLGEDDRLNSIVAAAASEALGASVQLVYRAGDEAVAQPTQPQPAPQPERAPDKEQLLEVGEGEIDPAGLVIDMLGGEVVEE